jgi:hypothetical protein
MMINETLSLGECPIIRPEGIYYGGRRVIALDPGLSGFGLGDVGDLLAYRQEWEPFIAAHLALWRRLNTLLENSSDAKQCPTGVFTDAQIDKNLNSTLHAFCASLALTRMYTSNTHPLGILTQWNAWKDKSSADIVSGAAAMLKWHQDVVMRVGGSDKDDLVEIAKLWDIDIQLPDLPSFSTQQEIIARIQGAYITTKGVLQIIGYGVGETLGMVSDATQAVAQGLTDTAKALPKTAHWLGIALGVTAAVVGGALIIYYVPRRSNEPSRTT